MSQVSAEERIKIVRDELLWKHPFFLIISFQLDWHEDNSQPTMCTNGRYLKWNRSFVESLSRPELLFVVIHELYHVILRHHIRAIGRQKKRWNIATDFAVNQELVELKVGQMPKRGYLSAEFAGLSAEEIYMRLPEQPEGRGGATFGEIEAAAEAGDEAAIAEAELHVRAMISQAADVASKSPGKVPAGFKKMIAELMEPKVDWRAVLHRFFAMGQRYDTTWLRPNRKFLHQGLYLPGVVREGINHVVFVRDTSGSLYGLEEQKLIASEIVGAFGDGVIDRLTVIDCDAAVQRVKTYESGDVVEVNCSGGGGTSFAPAMRHIAKHCPDAQAVIYFTDMYCDEFGPPPPCPTLWMVMGEKRNFERLSKVPPFGECIHIEA